MKSFSPRDWKNALRRTRSSSMISPSSSAGMSASLWGKKGSRRKRRGPMRIRIDKDLTFTVLEADGARGVVVPGFCEVN